MDFDVLSRSIADAVLLLAGGAFATTYFEFTRTTSSLSGSVVVAFLLGAILIAVAYSMRSRSPPEEVRLASGEAERIASKIQSREEAELDPDKLEEAGDGDE